MMIGARLLLALGLMGACDSTGGTMVTFHPVSAEGVMDSTIALSGYLAMPSAGRDGRVPGVVLVHGRSADRSQTGFLATALNQAGFATFSIDARGHGASGGEFPFSSPERSAIVGDDVLGAVEVLRSRRGINPGRLAAVGLSMGGSAVIAAAVQQPLPVVAWYPALAYLVDGDSMANIRSNRLQALIIHGTDDLNPRSDPAFSARLAGANPGVSLIWIEHGAHGYGRNRAEYLRHTLDSLSAWLGETGR